MKEGEFEIDSVKDARMRRHELTDDHWERIKDLLPGRVGDVGVTADNRLFVNAGFGIGENRDSVERSARTIREVEIGVSTVQPRVAEGSVGHGH